MLPDHDLFFDELYERTSEPFLTPRMGEAEVASFLALAQPDEGARVLDLGCGWGRHLAPLRNAKLRVVGVERSGRYAIRANQGGFGIARGDVRALPFATGAFDAVACFYASLFFFDDTENIEALRESARVLRPGGAFVLQAANPVHLRRLGAEERVFELPGGGSVRERIAFNATTGREEGHRTMTLADGTTREASFSIRHYAPGELEVIALRAGMKVERVCGDLALAPYGRGSREVVALMRKR